MFFSHPASLNLTSKNLFHELGPSNDEAKVFKLISQNIARVLTMYFIKGIGDLLHEGKTGICEALRIYSTLV